MKLKALLSSAGLSLFTMAVMPAQLMAQGVSSMAEHVEGPHYNLTDLGVVGATPGQPFHIANDGIISGSASVAKR